MLLADHGAEVIKIESAEGDSSRRSGPFKEDDLKRNWSGYFVSLNRNKKSICLNLKNAEDLELKLKSYLHHRDYEVEELGKTKIEKLMKTNETIYDMFGDKTSKKYGDDKRRKLDVYEINKLPIFIQKNLEKYKNWID